MGVGGWVWGGWVGLGWVSPPSLKEGDTTRKSTEMYPLYQSYVHDHLWGPWEKAFSCFFAYVVRPWGRGVRLAGVLGRLGDLLGGLRGSLGSSWGVFGANWDALGGSFGWPWGLFGPSWVPCEQNVLSGTIFGSPFDPQNGTLRHVKMHQQLHSDESSKNDQHICKKLNQGSIKIDKHESAHFQKTVYCTIQATATHTSHTTETSKTNAPKL